MNNYGTSNNSNITKPEYELDFLKEPNRQEPELDFLKQQNTPEPELDFLKQQENYQAAQDKLRSQFVVSSNPGIGGAVKDLHVSTQQLSDSIAEAFGEKVIYEDVKIGKEEFILRDEGVPFLGNGFTLAFCLVIFGLLINAIIQRGKAGDIASVVVFIILELVFLAVIVFLIWRLKKEIVDYRQYRIAYKNAVLAGKVPPKAKKEFDIFKFLYGFTAFLIIGFMVFGGVCLFLQEAYGINVMQNIIDFFNGTKN